MKFVASINKALDTLLEENDEVIFYGEDLADPYGGAFKVSKGLSSKYPSTVISTPISEAAIVGMAGGMAIAGLRPVVEIMFGDFLALAMDQLLNHLTKYPWMYTHRVSTPVTIRTAMGGRRGYGPTHSQSLEALLSSIPRLKILSPSIYHNPGEILKHCVLHDDVKIFSEHKMLYTMNLIEASNPPDGLQIQSNSNPYPTVRLSNCEFEPAELLIITHGGNSVLVEELMLELLLEYELATECILPSIIKPFPLEDIVRSTGSPRAILLLEESPTEFGWSAEVIAQLAEGNYLDQKRVIRIGARNTPIPSGAALEADVLPSKEKILTKIKNVFNL